MSSEEKEVDLPVAVRCMRQQNGYPDLESTAIGISILKPDDELVRKSDAEKLIQERIRQERQKILNEILELEAQIKADISKEVDQS